MSLKKSEGHMYPWVTHTHSHLGGECPHKCRYCYVDNPRFGRPARYQGELRLIEDEFKVKYRTRDNAAMTIFIENCNDMFAEQVPREFILAILDHCREWPANTYVLQTKNPARFAEFMDSMPVSTILGTTIETNRDMAGISNAPHPQERMKAMVNLQGRKFVTIEPVLDFDVDILAEWIASINPEFLNLGADSKNHNLPEPSVEKILELTERLRSYGIELREKHNLDRLKARRNHV